MSGVVFTRSCPTAACVTLAGKAAFEFFQPGLPGGAFQYLTLPENKEEEDTFNRLMTMFTKTMDTGVAKLHVRMHPRVFCCCAFQHHVAPKRVACLPACLSVVELPC